MEIVQLHATCVAIGGKGVLLTGESGAGKSDLALRLMDRGARLVADDRVEITRRGGVLSVTAPESIKGLLEVRGLGIFHVENIEKAELFLVVNLCKAEWVERLPYPEACNFLGLDVPEVRFCAFEQATPIKIEMALAARDDGSMKVGALKE